MKHVSKMGLIDRADYEINRHKWAKVHTNITQYSKYLNSGEFAEWFSDPFRTGWYYLEQNSLEHGYSEGITMSFSDHQVAFDYKLRFT